jgi:thiol-disulfide isomerase/thioredoxin/uncharacterized membrane protein YphA (DoxX/SURF4 family)
VVAPVGTLGLAAEVCLALVFAVSGCAKLADRDGTRQAVDGFGVPAGVAGPVALLLAPAELATACLLLVPATARAGLVLALLLLVAFSAAVVNSLARGRKPVCHCFGRLGGADVSGRTLARNVVLGLVAVLGLLGAGDEPTRVGAGLVTGVLVAAAVIAVEYLAGRAARAALERDQTQTFEAGAEPDRDPLPDFELPTVAGGSLSLGELLQPGVPVLVVSLAPGCGPCKELRPHVADWASSLRSRLTIAVLATGTLEANIDAYADHPHLPVLVDDGSVRLLLGNLGNPAAVLIDQSGRLASGVAAGEPLVRRLVTEAVAGGEVGDARPPRDGILVDDLGLDSVVEFAPTVEVQELGPSALALDRATGAAVTLDRIGAVVVTGLDGTASLRELADDLAEVFGAPVDTVQVDVLAVVRELGRAGLLAGVSAGDGTTGPTSPPEDPPAAPGPALTRDHA